MRPTRVLYVENDPTLRGIVSSIIGADPGIECIAAVGSADEALTEVNALHADVALLDLALGPDSLNGFELGLALRRRNPNIGIVLFSQHAVPDLLASVPPEDRWGWSFIEKTANVDIGRLIDVLRTTARGLNVLDPAALGGSVPTSQPTLAQLTPRQREVMALAAQGLNARAIGDVLGVSSASVRQDLSKAYAVLVPDASPGTDLRTCAVLEYLRLARQYAEDPSRL